MKLNTLPGTELAVSEVCLGTMTWGEQNTEAEAHAQLDFALDQGINFIDTAEMYPVPPDAATQDVPSSTSARGSRGSRAIAWSSPRRWQARVAANGSGAAAPISRAT